MSGFLRLSLCMGLVLSAGCATRRVEAEALSKPEDPAAWESLGDSYRRSGRQKKAHQAYSRALTLDPENEALVTRVNESTTGREIRKIRKLILQYPESDEAWGRAGVMAYEAGFNSLAVQYLQQALSMDPQDGEWLYYLSMVLPPEQYVELAQATAAAYPTDDELVGGVAWTLWELDEGAWRERACVGFHEALALDEEDEEWRSAVNDCADQGFGAPADAVVGLEDSACLALDGAALDLSAISDPAVLTAIAQGLAAGGARDQALTVYRRLLRVAPGIDTAGAVATLEGSDALSVLDALVAEDPQDWRRQLALGDYRAALGDLEGAAVSWGEAGRLAPGEPEVRARLGMIP